MYNTGNPLGSTSPKDFSDNAEITDHYVNDVVNETTLDRFGRSRLTIRGLEKKAQLDIAAGVADATAEAGQYRDQALAAKNAAQEAAMMSGFSKYAETLAQLEAGVGTDYVEGDVVLVFQDESRSGTSSIFKIESGTAEFKLTFDKTRQDLLSFTGNVAADVIWSDVPAHSDPAFDTQTQALADRVEFLRDISKNNLESVRDLMDRNQSNSLGVVYSVKGYHAGTTIGGGLFFWDSDMPKSMHDAGTVFDPEKVFPKEWGNPPQTNNWFTPNGSGSGCWVRLNRSDTLQCVDYGVLYTNVFNPAIAFANRKAIEKMLRNQAYSNFVLNADGATLWTIGTIHPKRSNITIHHKKGCNLKAKYEAAGYDAPQSGGAFGFPMYRNPEGSTAYDFGIMGVVEGVKYILDGDIATIHDSGYSVIHNNNCLGFYVSRNCQVIGSGGVSESDHHGINFDGLSTNITVDVAYIRSTSNTPVLVNALDPLTDAPSGIDIGPAGFAKIIVGEIANIKFDDPSRSSKNYTQVGGQADANVYVGRVVGLDKTKGTLCASYECTSIEIGFGYIEKINLILNQYDTLDSKVRGKVAKDISLVVRRGGVKDAQRSVDISVNEFLGNTPMSFYISENDAGTFHTYRVKDCDFSKVTAAVTPYSGSVLTASQPRVIDFSGNIPNSTYAGKVGGVIFWNKQKHVKRVVAINDVATLNVAGDFADYPYNKITGGVSHSTGIYQFEFDLTQLYITSQPFIKTLTQVSGTPLNLTFTRSGDTLTVTSTAIAGYVISYIEASSVS